MRGFYQTLDMYLNTPFCDTPNTPLHLLLFYPIGPLIVTSTMFTMTFWKCASTLYTYRSSRMPVLSLFLRDGVFWFLAVFGSRNVVSFLNWRFGRGSLSTLLNS
ncbi:hypothetical protein BD779DRAFT_1591778 [Infundibulicybe gibba]|nr:hypothetical protein BD779DRAFT_1591778 [Infundibulicybe gibba]